MMKRAKYAAMAGLLIIPAAAFTFGGWATITVEDLPEYARMGFPTQMTYTVRQHGMTFMDRLPGTVMAQAGETEIRGTVTPLGSGRYRATLNFPETGQWRVAVHSGFLSSRIELMPMPALSPSAPAPAPQAAADRGRNLFVAKGCVTCHTHQLTKGYTSTKSGPDLSEPKFVSSYLTKFLADPTIKTNWANTNRMPNLDLKAADIASLVAFLNRETVASR